MDCQYFFLVGEGELVDWVDDLYVGVGNEDVQCVECGYYFVGVGVYCCFVGNVYGDVDCFVVCGGDFCCGGIGGLLVDVVDGDCCVFFCVQFGDCFVEVVCCVGD